MTESPDWDEWNERRRIEMQRWQQEEDRLHQPAHPPSDWPAPSNQSVNPIRFDEPSSADSGGGDASSGEPIDPAAFSSGLAFIAALPVWPVLYAVPSAIALGLTGVVYGMLEAKFAIYRPEGRLAIGLLAGTLGVIAAVTLGRYDHRLAKSRWWWVPRHLVRLALFGFLAHMFAATKWWPRHPETSPVPGLLLLRNPVYLAGVGAVVVVVHLILTRPALRDWWHRRLEAVFLRPA